MPKRVNKHYTLDRNPESEEWDACPGCDGTLFYRGDDEYQEDWDRYAFFVCENAECRVREVVARHRENESEQAPNNAVEKHGRL